MCTRTDSPGNAARLAEGTTMDPDPVKDLQRGAARLLTLHYATLHPVSGVWLSEELSRRGHRIPPGTLYPMLHRLEDGGLVRSENQPGRGPLTRLYRLTPTGRQVLQRGRESFAGLGRQLLPGSLLDSRNSPQRGGDRSVEKIYEFYIRTSPEHLWFAITDPDSRAKYNFGMGAHSDWLRGSRIEMVSPKGEGLLGEGHVLEADPPRKLVHTMIATWSDEVKSEGATRVTWEIEPVSDSCRLLLTHDQMREGASEQIYGGWPMILSGLKTWLETSTVLTTPGSLMYS